jgi:hypothetical protein
MGNRAEQRHRQKTVQDKQKDDHDPSQLVTGFIPDRGKLSSTDCHFGLPGCQLNHSAWSNDRETAQWPFEIVLRGTLGTFASKSREMRGHFCLPRPSDAKKPALSKVSMNVLS